MRTDANHSDDAAALCSYKRPGASVTGMGCSSGECLTARRNPANDKAKETQEERFNTKVRMS